MRTKLLQFLLVIKTCCGFVLINIDLVTVAFFVDIHTVHSTVNLRPTDVDGLSVDLRVRLLKRRHHRRLVQAVLSTARTGTAG